MATGSGLSTRVPMAVCAPAKTKITTETQRHGERIVNRREAEEGEEYVEATEVAERTCSWVEFHCPEHSEYGQASSPGTSQASAEFVF